MNEIAKVQIEKIKKRCEGIRPLVVIRCITFNHGPYIKDALEGFVMQKTDFPFVAIVHDDASTDNTAEIIKEYSEKYPDIILPIYEKENQYSKRDGSLGTIMNRACEETRAKYIAWCEGDDYWIDPLKLQKQVDFLDSNPDYSMVYTKVYRCYESMSTFKDKWGEGLNKNLDLLVSNPIPTPTVLLRKQILFDYQTEVNPREKHWMMGDYPLWIYASIKGNIKFIDTVTATYRILQNSASHQYNFNNRIRFSINSSEICLFFAEKYTGNPNIIKRIKNDLHFKYFLQSYMNDNKKEYLEKIKTLLISKSKLKKKLFIVLSIIGPKKIFKKFITNYYTNY